MVIQAYRTTAMSKKKELTICDSCNKPAPNGVLNMIDVSGVPECTSYIYVCDACLDKMKQEKEDWAYHPTYMFEGEWE